MSNQWQRGIYSKEWGDTDWQFEAMMDLGDGFSGFWVNDDEILEALLTAGIEIDPSRYEISQCNHGSSLRLNPWSRYGVYSWVKWVPAVDRRKIR